MCICVQCAVHLSVHLSVCNVTVPVPMSMGCYVSVQYVSVQYMSVCSDLCQCVYVNM